jgi:SAM-dependent methyltransferase
MKSKSDPVKSFSSDARRSAPDWSTGRYENTAATLLPAAHEVIAAAEPGQGEHLVDLGCGTGNAALLAAERGATVTGIDPAERLTAVAEQEARRRGLDARFVHGEASALPLADGSVDVLVSVFGVIFAPDAELAISEIARVLTHRGRVALSAWIPTGAISASTRVVREAVMRAISAPPGPPPFAWHERSAIGEIFGAHGFDVELEQRTLAFTAQSASDHVANDFENHPLWLAARGVLSEQEARSAREKATEILEEANEQPGAFQVTSSYVIITARRGEGR